MFSRRVTKPKRANHDHDRQRGGSKCYLIPTMPKKAQTPARATAVTSAAVTLPQNKGTVAAATMGVRDTVTVGATLA
jgi:hypothetical protein